MAELLLNSETDSEQAAELLDKLSKENRELRKLNHQLKSNRSKKI